MKKFFRRLIVIICLVGFIDYCNASILKIDDENEAEITRETIKELFEQLLTQEPVHLGLAQYLHNSHRLSLQGSKTEIQPVDQYVQCAGR